MHFSASVTICVFLNEDNEEKWAQATFSPDYETEGKRFRINPMHMNFGNLIVFLNYSLHWILSLKGFEKGEKTNKPSASTFLNATNEAIN